MAHSFSRKLLFLIFFIWLNPVLANCNHLTRTFLSTSSGITPLTRKNLNQAIELIQKYFADSLDKEHLKLIRNDLRGSLGDPRYKKLMNKWYQDGWVKYFVSLDPETKEIKGVIGLFKDKKDSKEALWITSLVVSEKARGQGLGKALIHYAERYASSKNLTYLRLYTSSEPFMSSAQGLYEREGYEMIKSFPQSIDGKQTGHTTYLRQKRLIKQKLRFPQFSEE